MKPCFLWFSAFLAVLAGMGRTSQNINHSIMKVFIYPISVRSIAAVIPVFITGRPFIKKWGDYSKFDIPTVAEYLWGEILHMTFFL